MNFTELLNNISNIVWGPITLTLLLGVGIYLTFGLKAFHEYWKGRGEGGMLYQVGC